MPIAVLPSGSTKYVDNNLDVSIALRDKGVSAEIDRLVRATFSSDPRLLCIRVQGDGGFGPWTVWATWGSGADRKATPPVVLAENEHSPEVVVARIKAALDTLAEEPTSTSRPSA